MSDLTWPLESPAPEIRMGQTKHHRSCVSARPLPFSSQHCNSVLLNNGLLASLSPSEVSQSVSHYHTPSRELMDHTHSTVLLSSTVIISATFVFLFFLSLVFRQGSHLRMIFFSLRFSPLLLVVDLDENGPRC